MSTVPPLEAYDLLRRMQESASVHGIRPTKPRWIEALNKLRGGLAAGVFWGEQLTDLEQRAGGYWVDTPAPSRDLARFIHVEMCINCQSLRIHHLNETQCLFSPGSCFKETVP